MNKFTIVGCGMAGPAVALALAKQGMRAVLLDRETRMAAPDFGRAVNITLCTRGIDALQKIGLATQAVQKSLPLYGRMVHDRNGSRHFEAYGPKQEALYSIRRHDLREMLIDAVAADPQIELISEARCSAIDLAAGQIAIVVGGEASARTIDFEHLVAADGVNSTVRTCLEEGGHWRAESRNVNMGYFELLIDAKQVARLALEHDSLHFWPRGQTLLIGFPNLDGSITLSLHMPLSGPLSFESIATDRAVWDFFTLEFPDLVEALPAILTGTQRKRLGRVKCVQCHSWFLRDRVVLIGDAAHGMIPYYGQGANAGFEDASVLADLLAENPDDCERAFARFEQSRKADLDFMSNLCFQHLELLRSALGTQERQILSRVEQAISTMTPHRSLYYHISFSKLSYLEAHRVSHFFHSVAQSAVEHLRQNLDVDDSDIREAIRVVLARSSHELASAAPSRTMT